MDNNNNITIDNCPICSKSHTYDVSIRKTSLMTFTKTEDERGIQKVPVTRLFSCPDKEGNFEITFLVLKTPDEIIKEITISQI